MLDDDNTIRESFGPRPTRTLKTPFYYKALTLLIFSFASLQPCQLLVFLTSRLVNYTRDQS
jgi:hypothetical protein